MFGRRTHRSASCRLSCSRCSLRPADPSRATRRTHLTTSGRRSSPCFGACWLASSLRWLGWPLGTPAGRTLLPSGGSSAPRAASSGASASSVGARRSIGPAGGRTAFRGKIRCVSGFAVLPRVVSEEGGRLTSPSRPAAHPLDDRPWFALGQSGLAAHRPLHGPQPERCPLAGCRSGDRAWGRARPSAVGCERPAARDCARLAGSGGGVQGALPLPACCVSRPLSARCTEALTS